MSAGDAWYVADRQSFVDSPQSLVVDRLASSASRRGWHVEADQHREWRASVDTLQGDSGRRRRDGIEIVRQALQSPKLSDISHVLLEYDFRRRGLRIDCVLLAPGAILVLEFKRTKLTAADRDQVAHYCISLVEFHEETQRLIREQKVVVIPILVLTEGAARRAQSTDTSFCRQPWQSVLKKPIECDRGGVTMALEQGLALRRATGPVDALAWRDSRFAPSSTILDAAISLFGNHDVSSIDEHAAPIETIEACTAEVADEIRRAQEGGQNRIVFVSGAPGAGKTLVGLKLAFDPQFRQDAVFVTGNAPLVDVLTQALKYSYQGLAKRDNQLVPTGYASEDVQEVIRNATFKIVKAHSFLGERGAHTRSSDGRIVVFDEAQRTYEKGRRVAGHRLSDHEADLILASLEESYEPGAVVVAIVGHNQAINTGERGIAAWFEAAARRNWEFAISDETLQLDEVGASEKWGTHSLRRPLRYGHLSHSIRYYRNKGVEQWAHEVLDGSASNASRIAERLASEGHAIWITRQLGSARSWARKMRVGEERIGLIASGQARRLAAEGLFVGLKPPIAHWMLAPSGDVRSSNMLEVVQNQYQVQGLELDYTIVCWDADLRREADSWRSFKISGAGWQRDKALDVSKNSYRVLLTRARKGMVVFVPLGDPTGEDPTRSPEFYNDIARFLERCGAAFLTGHCAD